MKRQFLLAIFTFLLKIIEKRTAQMTEWNRASASGAADLGVIPSRIKPMTCKLVFTASLLDA